MRTGSPPIRREVHAGAAGAETEVEQRRLVDLRHCAGRGWIRGIASRRLRLRGSPFGLLAGLTNVIRFVSVLPSPLLALL